MVLMKVKLVTWEEIVNWSYSLGRKIKSSGYNPNVIIAIARGGLVPARLVADVLGVIDVLSIKVEHWIKTAEHVEYARIKYPFIVDLTGKKVLIIDDICDTGDSLEITKNYLEKNNKPKEIKTATMQYIEKTAKFEPDYYVDIVKEWTWYMYPWNYWEDEINLVRKLIEKPNAQVNAEELKRRFIEAYGINPPINIEEILSEIRGS